MGISIGIDAAVDVAKVRLIGVVVGVVVPPAAVWSLAIIIIDVVVAHRGLRMLNADESVFTVVVVVVVPNVADVAPAAAAAATDVAAAAAVAFGKSVCLTAARARGLILVVVVLCRMVLSL